MKHKLNRLLLNATKTIEYYQPFFQEIEKMVDNNVSSKKILDQFPVINKSIYIKNMDIIIPNSFDKANLFKEFTSGSTGEPFACYKTYRDKFQIARSLTQLRRNIYNEFNVTDKFLRFYGSWTPYNIQRNALLISVFYYNSNWAKAFCDMILEFQPKWIFGIPSAVYDFIYLVKINNLDEYLRSKIKINYIEVTGEILTESMRASIENFFGSRVINHYGCREIWHIAFSCQENKFHIIDDNALVQIVDEYDRVVPDGEEGQIVITGLNNFDIPFIRYKTGDIGKIEHKPCKCGNPKRVIQIFGGRISERIQLEHGQQISSVVVHHIFRKIESMGLFSIKKYLVKQIEINRLLFLLEVDNAYTNEYEQAIIELGQKVFGSDMKYEFEYTQIPVEKNCKRKSFMGLESV